MFYIDELLRAQLWPPIHIISNTQFWQLAVFVRRKALLSVMSCQSSHIRMLALLSGHVTSHKTQFLIPNEVATTSSSPQNPATLPLLSLGAIFVLTQVLRKPLRKFTSWWDWDCFMRAPSKLQQGSPWHSWFFAYIQLATHANHYYICLFVCSGPGCPLHFLSAMSEAKLEQNCSNAVVKSHSLPSCTLQT